MRFIINFIVFGLIFYAIYYFFPEAFQTLTDWAGKIFEFFRNLINETVDRFKDKTAAAPQRDSAAMFLAFLSQFRRP